jgi:hypothetical protein
VGDPGGVKRRAAAMQAWPAMGKLVKVAKACLPRPRAEQPFRRGNDNHSGVAELRVVHSCIIKVRIGEIRPARIRIVRSAMVRSAPLRLA